MVKSKNSPGNLIVFYYMGLLEKDGFPGAEHCALLLHVICCTAGFFEHSSCLNLQ